jgi:phosphate uptake regulator
MGTEASGLLDHAGRAFAVLDGDLAQEVVDADAPVRESHRGFLAALYTQHALPVGAAVECGVVARCYERIADHALEIAQRVRFVATGP